MAKDMDDQRKPGGERPKKPGRAPRQQPGSQEMARPESTTGPGDKAKERAQLEKARAEMLEQAARREEQTRKQGPMSARPMPDTGAHETRRHVVASGETLGHIAQQYYGSSGQEYWMVIYEANRQEIGDDPGRISPGIELVIPAIRKP